MTSPSVSATASSTLWRPVVWLFERFDASMTLAVQLVGAVVIVLIGTAAAELLYLAFDMTRLSIFFLAAVLVSALLLGTWGGVFAAILAFAAYNFTLVEPLFTLQFAGPDDALTLFVFLLVALVTGSLAGRVRESERHNRQRADLLATLLEAGQTFAAAPSEAELTQALSERLNAATNGVSVILPDGGALSDKAFAYGPRGVMEGLVARAQMDAGLHAHGAWRSRRISADEPLGLALWRIGETRARDVQAQDRLCEFLIDLAAAALARSRRAGIEADLEADRRAEPLREAILGSLSHDLRTPLATVLASASSLRDYDDRFDPQTRVALADGIVQEAGRLNGYVEGLLNLSRIEAGQLETRLVDLGLSEIVEAAVRRLPAARAVGVETALDPSLAVRADPVLLEQVLYNLLENALQHGGQTVRIAVSTRRRDDRVEIEVMDDGPGVSPLDAPKVFDKFYRGSGSRREGRGTGIGLSVARGFVEAMGGRIGVVPHDAGKTGLRVRIALDPAPDSRRETV